MNYLKEKDKIPQYFDIKNLNSEITITLNKAKYNHKTVKKYIFLFVNQKFDIDSKNKNDIIQSIKILKKQNGLHLEFVIKNK